IDVGLYKDIALHISLPVILSNTRSLTPIGNGAIPAATAGAPGETLFSVPFTGPTRSGLEHIAAGFDFTILNQARDRTKPTALFEFQQNSSDYGITNLSQSLVNHPPLVGTMILGMMIHPWENREKYGRLTFDLRFVGQYHSEGRDYSELFDALGSSSVPSLRQ